MLLEGFSNDPNPPTHNLLYPGSIPAPRKRRAKRTFSEQARRNISEGQRRSADGLAISQRTTERLKGTYERKNPLITKYLIRDLLYEGSIATFSGSYNCGKTPVFKDWAIAIASGQPWCGAATTRHPVVMLDFESKDTAFFEGDEENGGWDHICRRRGIDPTTLPVEFFIDHGDLDHPRTKETERILCMGIANKFQWIEEKFALHPDTVMFIDPIQLLFNFDKNKSTQVVSLYNHFRAIQRRYRAATFLLVFNLRKRNPSFPPPPLIERPHEWLQELPGSLDLQSRADIRLGIEPLDAEDRTTVVVNGAIRGQTMEPFVIEPEWYEERTAGFRRVAAKNLDREVVLTKSQVALWAGLADTFTQADMEMLVSKSAVHRFRARVESLGLVRVTALGAFQKQI